MKKWIEYDPNTGVKEINYSSDDDDKIIVTKLEDVQALLDRNAELRNTRATDAGIKKGIWHYANIPITVQYELLKKGININRREDMPRLREEIEKNYPKLKTTDKIHLPPRKGSRKPEASTKPGPFVIVR